jgi:xanthine dehydrogenase accessory factor
MGPFEDDDHAALAAAAQGGWGLCTVVGIEGSFSRRLGAQLAIHPDGRMAGSLADGCLENQLRTDCAQAREPMMRRYGRGSEMIDFRLPCGGGLDILIDPAPDRAACLSVLADLSARKEAAFSLPENPNMEARAFIPALALRLFGEGPEPAATAQLAQTAGIAATVLGHDDLALGRSPDLPLADKWTASVLLFHDHEWELPILQHALDGNGFYIGAQGGATARAQRLSRLRDVGVEEAQLARIRAPIGTVPSSRTPRSLALSILSEVVGAYEAIHPHA